MCKQTLGEVFKKCQKKLKFFNFFLKKALTNNSSFDIIFLLTWKGAGCSR